MQGKEIAGFESAGSGHLYKAETLYFREQGNLKYK